MANSWAGNDRQDFWKERGTLGKREVELASKTRRDSDVQNGGEVKSHMAECR